MDARLFALVDDASGGVLIAMPGVVVKGLISATSPGV
jgi:hypothetical protein